MVFPITLIPIDIIAGVAGAYDGFTSAHRARRLYYTGSALEATMVQAFTKETLAIEGYTRASILASHGAKLHQLSSWSMYANSFIKPLTYWIAAYGSGQGHFCQLDKYLQAFGNNSNPSNTIKSRLTPFYLPSQVTPECSNGYGQFNLKQLTQDVADQQFFQQNLRFSVDQTHYIKDTSCGKFYKVDIKKRADNSLVVSPQPCSLSFNILSFILLKISRLGYYSFDSKSQALPYEHLLVFQQNEKLPLYLATSPEHHNLLPPIFSPDSSKLDPEIRQTLPQNLQKTSPLLTNSHHHGFMLNGGLVLQMTYCTDRQEERLSITRATLWQRLSHFCGLGGLKTGADISKIVNLYDPQRSRVLISGDFEHENVRKQVHNILDDLQRKESSPDIELIEWGNHRFPSLEKLRNLTIKSLFPANLPARDVPINSKLVLNQLNISYSKDIQDKRQYWLSFLKEMMRYGLEDFKRQLFFFNSKPLPGQPSIEHSIVITFLVNVPLLPLFLINSTVNTLLALIGLPNALDYLKDDVFLADALAQSQSQVSPLRSDNCKFSRSTLPYQIPIAQPIQDDFPEYNNNPQAQPFVNQHQTQHQPKVPGSLK